MSVSVEIAGSEKVRSFRQSEDPRGAEKWRWRISRAIR
jgi:hypothetical protein